MPVSTDQTWSPRLRWPSARCEPMKPPPPVMRTFILFSELGSFAQEGPDRGVVRELAALDTIRSIARCDKSFVDQGAGDALPRRGGALPHHELPAAQEREGAREGVGDRADQAVDPPGGLAPVDAAVVGPPATAIGGLRVVLRDPRRRAGADRGPDLPQEDLRLVDRAEEEVPGGVARTDRPGALGHDVAGVGRLHHVVQGHARLLLALDQRPVDGRPTPEPRELRAMEVERSARRQAQLGYGDDGAVVGGEDQLGLEAADCLLYVAFLPVDQGDFGRGR